MTGFRCALVLVALSGLVGCGLSPVGERAEIDMTTTGSITPTASATATAPSDAPLGYAATPPIQKPRSVIDGVAPSDWERIRLFASTSVEHAKNGEVLDWVNPGTGSNGTISPLASSRAAPGNRQCRAFALTISDVRGIRRYRGDACHTPDGMWQLFDVTPDDGTLL